MSHRILAMSAINVGLALYAGFFIPPEHHAELAIPVKDYFLISFIAFCLSLYIILNQKNT